MAKKKKKDAQYRINSFIQYLESKGLIKPTPGFLHSYATEYPYFKILEENYEVIRRECESVLSFKESITDISNLDGKGKTGGGIHTIKWKTFMFKSGNFIEENCALCPETARLLKKVPRIKQAFFSILDPEQYIRPHRGYFQGFLRYHLGLIIPNDNQDKKCWIRITDDMEENRKERLRLVNMESGETYYWKEGEGIIFNDNYVHEAANESDFIRVILWVDVLRKFPFWLDWFNKLILFVAYRTKQAKNIAKNAIVKVPKNS